MKRLKQFYKLIPFKENEKRRIGVSFEFDNNIFKLNYKVSSISDIILPDLELKPSLFKREDNLWKTTCFEFFISLNGKEEYYEINVSPDYRYAIYHFDGYRKNMMNSDELEIRDIKVFKDNNFLNLQVILDTKFKEPNVINFDYNISTIIHTEDNNFEYWALKHLNRPDFHNRDLFYTFK